MPSRSGAPVRRRLTNRIGVSLVELTVAITLVGIATAIAVPKMNDIANQNKVLRAAQTLQIEIQQAFVIAGRNRTPVTVRWNTSSVQLQVANLAGNIVFRRASLGEGGQGLKAAEVTVSPAVFTVFPNGLAADTMLITLSRRNYSKTIRVSRAGMVRIQ